MQIPCKPNADCMSLHDFHLSAILSLCRLLPCADSYPMQIPTLCIFPCSCMILTWLPLLSCADSHANQLSSCTNPTLLPFYILSNREQVPCQHFEQGKLVICPR